MLLQRVQTLRDAFCTSIFGDFEQVEDLVYTFDEGPSTPITEDMLDSLASEEAGFDSQLVTRARLQAACFVATIGDDSDLYMGTYATVLSIPAVIDEYLDLLSVAAAKVQ